MLTFTRYFSYIYNLLRTLFPEKILEFVLLLDIIILPGCELQTGKMLIPVFESQKLQITSPQNDSYFSYGDKIQFSFDLKDVQSDIHKISWISDIDGKFGYNQNFDYDILSLGKHEISVYVSFTDSLRIQNNITITICGRNENANVQIISPQIDSLWFYDTDPHVFESLVTDSVGNVIAEKSFAWISNHDGLVSASDNLSVQDLSVNTHIITLQVTFGDGTLAKDSLENIQIIKNEWANTDLLNDREMETQEDPGAPYVRDAWINWIRENSVPVRSLHSEDFSDLAFLNDLLNDKSIVQMGEVAHGIAEQNRGRVRLIKYLHQHLGFSVLAFESGFYDCYMANKNIENSSAKDGLENSLYTMWHTTDLLELYEYVKSTRHSDNPLNICGFDIRPTGAACTSRPEFLKNIISKVDTNFANEIFEIDKMLILWLTDRTSADNYIIENYTQLIKVYDRLIKLISENEDYLGQFFKSELLSVALQSTISARVHIDQRNDSRFEGYERSLMRDKQMFEHFKYINQSLYPDQKIIVWSHNYHIMNNPEQAKYTKTLGYWLKQNYSTDLYTIWSLAYRGIIRYGEIYRISITDPECIEAILYRAMKKHYIIDISRQSMQEGNNWMFQYTTQSYLHGTGAYRISYIPRHQYDAIFFIDTVSKPVYFY